MIGPPPIDYGPAGLWTHTATVSVPTFGKDAAGRPSTSYTTTENVPCSIQAGAGDEALRQGAGAITETRVTYTGLFPARIGGAVLAIPAKARAIVESVTYEATGAGVTLFDGVQSVPLEVKT